MTRLRFEGVAKRYDTARGESVAALEGIDLEVASGEFVCVVGRSGCGKTTLLRIAAGLEAPTAGAVVLDGVAVERPSTAIGVVFQEDRLLPWRTVAGNVGLGLEIRGVGAARRRQVVEKYLRLVDLEGFADAFPGELSGGMRQRAAIARALVNEPEVILMDEPFGALDAQTRNQMQEELLRIQECTSSTVVFVTHSVDEAVVLANRVVVLSQRPGRIHWECRIELGRPRDRTSAAANDHRRRILDALNGG